MDFFLLKYTQAQVIKLFYQHKVIKINILLSFLMGQNFNKKTVPQLGKYRSCLTYYCCHFYSSFGVHKCTTFTENPKNGNKYSTFHCVSCWVLCNDIRHQAESDVHNVEINYVCAEFFWDSITKIASNKGKRPESLIKRIFMWLNCH